MTDDPARQRLLRGIAQTFEGLQRAGLTHTSRPLWPAPSGDAPLRLSLPLNVEIVPAPEPYAPPAAAGSYAPAPASLPVEPAAYHPPVAEEPASPRLPEVPAPYVAASPPASRPAGPARLFDADELKPARPHSSTGTGPAGREAAFALVTRSDRETGLAVLQQEVKPCTRCNILAKTRKQTVFAAGNPHCQLLVIGEAPGADEDRIGEPFVGKAGKKLDEMLAAMGLDRSTVYIMNALKCRPPENRVPAPEELENCRPFFLRQLDLIAPKFILCVGVTAANALLQRTESVGRLRNKVYDYRGAKVVCTYHPSYILRSPEKARRPVWEDLLLLMGEMGIKPKNKQS